MNERIAPGFQDLLANFDSAGLENRTNTVFGLWDDMSLAYFNPGWISFAEANGGEPAISHEWRLGRSVFDAIPAVMQRFYHEFLQTGLHAAPETNRFPVNFEYECSSDSTYRRYVMLLYSLSAGKGLLVVNSLVSEDPHDPEKQIACQPDARIYADNEGTIHQCAHCRRIENLTVPNRWDWVPAWVKKIPQNASHTLCNICLDYYYPDPKTCSNRSKLPVQKQS
jgi:hypothetical protein